MIAKINGRLVIIRNNPDSSAAQKRAAAASGGTSKTSYGDALKYGLIAGGIVVLGLVGYGVYTFLNNASTNGAVVGCQQELQSLTTQYATTYQGYLKQNGGAALTSAQEANLSAISKQMDSAQQCMVTAQGYGVTVAGQTITSIAIVAAAAIGATSAFGAYLKYRAGKYGSGNVQSTSEARAAIRNAGAQTEANSGAITPEDASGQIESTNNIAAEEAASQTTSATSAAESAVSAAEQAGDSNLVLDIQTYISDAIETITTFITEVYDYFYTLFA